jgi:hypothetical protein
LFYVQKWSAAWPLKVVQDVETRELTEEHLVVNALARRGGLGMPK